MSRNNIFVWKQRLINACFLHLIWTKQLHRSKLMNWFVQHMKMMLLVTALVGNKIQKWWFWYLQTQWRFSEVTKWWFASSIWWRWHIIDNKTCKIVRRSINRSSIFARKDLKVDKSLGTAWTITSSNLSRVSLLA